MIVRLTDNSSLYDQEALATELRLSKRTVRRRCAAIACDVATRAPLYDPDDAAAVLGAVRPRPARTRPAQMLRRMAIA